MTNLVKMSCHPSRSPQALEVQVRARLDAVAQADDCLTPLAPERLARGSWWSSAWDWPASLRAGVLEPRRGYRYRPENLALGWLLRGTSAERLLDLGAGSGSLLLLASAFTRPRRLVGVERQASMLDRLRRTVTAHRLGAQVVEGDLRSPDTQGAVCAHLGGLADLIVTNPPFFPAGWGRPSRNPSTRLSTHAEHGDVRDFLSAARALLAPGGVLRVVFDAQRLAELLAASGACGLVLVHLLWIPDQRPGLGHQPFRVWASFAHPGGVASQGPGAAIDRLPVVTPEPPTR